jgi:ribonuclease BN (tRNA processing enzyme)
MTYRHSLHSDYLSISKE